MIQVKNDVVDNSSTPSLVVSHDAEFSQKMMFLLGSEQVQAERAPSYSEAEQILKNRNVQSVFIDLRPSELYESPGSLLDQLARRNGNRIPVISIGSEGYETAWAVAATLAIDSNLTLPLDQGALARIVHADTFHCPPHRSPQLTEPWVIDTDRFSYVCHTPDMFQMLDHLVMMATHDVTLLLIGETGTGKTTVARLIHELSPRRQEPFLTVACGSLPPDLIESELFGHVRGAFTSADRSKVGKFEAAAGGSLLLDEIDVLGANQQTKLLRVIETGEFEPVGSNETHRSDARLIVASNVDLKGLMEQDEFRPDLYYRLNVLEFHIPPLRQRPRDIVPLTLGFIEEFSTTHGVPIHRVHPEFLTVLKNYPWPGNIRELKNHVRRSVLFCRTGELTPRDLAPVLTQAKPMLHPTNPVREPATLHEKVAMNEQEILESALRAHGYKRTATAQSLGISRVGLYKKMKKYGMLTSTRTPRNTPEPVRDLGLNSAASNSPTAMPVRATPAN